MLVFMPLYLETFSAKLDPSIDLVTQEHLEVVHAS